MIWLIRILAIIGLCFIGLGFYEKLCGQVPLDEYTEEYFAGEMILWAIGLLLELLAGVLYLAYLLF